LLVTDHGFGRDLPLWTLDQARLDRRHPHGRDGRERGRDSIVEIAGRASSGVHCEPFPFMGVAVRYGERWRWRAILASRTSRRRSEPGPSTPWSWPWSTCRAASSASASRRNIFWTMLTRKHTP